MLNEQRLRQLRQRVLVSYDLKALTPEQVARIDTIYRESLPERRRLREQLTCLQNILGRVLDDGRRQVGAFYLPGDMFGMEFGDEHRCSAEAIGSVTVRVFKRSASRTRAWFLNMSATTPALTGGALTSTAVCVCMCLSACAFVTLAVAISALLKRLT
jgi:hypothetical protein